MGFFCHSIVMFFFFFQIFARTDVDTQVLVFSKEGLVPCSVSADMTLAQVTTELVKVRTACF